MFWVALGAAGKPRELGGCWKLLGGSGSCWEALGAAGRLWELLGSPWRFWFVIYVFSFFGDPTSHVLGCALPTLNTTF